jgi:Xaa-Pro aminopeptidase
MKKRFIHLTIILPVFISMIATGQDKHHYQTDFSKEEFAERRSKIVTAIGDNAITSIWKTKF